MPTLTSPAAHRPAAPPAAHLDPQRRSLLAWWHLLSLDAPSLAALWTWLVAAAAGVRLPSSALAAMFLAVWILYAADRLLDARGLPAATPETDRSTAAGTSDFEERHLFHGRHRSAFLVAITAAAIALAALLPRLPSPAIRLDLLLGALLAGYFLLIHVDARAPRLPKEIAVGIFFSAAIFIPTVSRVPGLRLALLVPALLFAALCSLNCLCIYGWEHAAVVDSRERRAPTRSQLPHSPTAVGPHPLTRLALRRRIPLLRALVLVSFAAAPLVSAPLLLAIASSAIALLLLDRVRHRLRRIDLRAAADLALATPLCILPLLRHLR